MNRAVNMNRNVIVSEQGYIKAVQNAYLSEFDHAAKIMLEAYEIGMKNAGYTDIELDKLEYKAVSEILGQLITPTRRRVKRK